jgi:superfamily II DNA or RNA helicase
VEGFLEAVREGCKPVQWTRAVQAVREAKVHPLRKRGQAYEFRVETKPGLPAHTVSIEPSDDDWDCDCDARTESCEHVAAAAIFLKQSLDAGRDPFAQASSVKLGHVGYRLSSRKGPIKLERVIVAEGGEVSMPGPIAKIERKMGREGVPPFTIDQADRDFEQRFGVNTKVLIPERAMAVVLEYLSRVADLKLDGREVELGEPSPGMRVRISETPQGGFVARIEQDSDITELYENGAFRRGRVLHAVGQHKLPAKLFESLRKGQVFEARDVGVLVGQVLPEVRRSLPVTIDAPNLPGSKPMRPRIQLTTLREGDVLQVLPTIVYGDPPVARVDGERLTLLDPPRKAARAEAGATNSQPALADLPIRDARLEKLLRMRLRDRFELEPGQRKNLGAKDAIELAAALEALSAETGSHADDIALAGAAHEEFFAAGTLAPHLRVGEGGKFDLLFTPEDEQFDPAWFDLDPRAEFSSLDDDVHPLDRGSARRRRARIRRADVGAVVRAWQSGEEFAPLLGGGFGRIPAEFMAKHGHLVADLLAAREALAADKNAAAARANVFDLAELAAALEEAPPPEFGKLQALVGDFEQVPTAALPGDLQAELRDYQRRGVDWLAFLREAELGALLADDMGLGKTLQAICVLRSGNDAQGKLQSLVVSPTSVLHNWKAELGKFRPGMQVSVYHGAARSFDEQADVVLTTYAILRLDIDRLLARRWDAVVLDEAQAIKNPTSKVARAAYRLQARFKMALTGTPVENHLEDLWSQFHFLQPGLLGGRSEFSDRYVRAVSLGDEQAALRLRRRIKPFVLRRLKREVAKELPPRTDVVLRCELRPAERRVYDAVRAATQEQVVESLAGGADVMQVLEALLRLRQAACHTALLPGGYGRQKQAAASEPAAETTSSKLELLLETLEEVLDEGHKALVFSQWTSLLDLVEPVLRSKDIRFTRLDGTTRDRQAVVDGFQDPAGPPVMLLSLKAGGTGLNLTAADNVFLLDPWWNPAVEDQAADRAHRIGQDKPVIVHRLIAGDTVEERILALQDHKRTLAQTAVGDAAGAHAITRAELLALLE